MKHERYDAKVGEFYEKAGRKYKLDFNAQNIDELVLRTNLVLEEAKELYEEMFDIAFMMQTGPEVPDPRVENLLKELGDVFYTAYGLAGTLGVDPDVLINRIIHSNLSKVEGGVVLNDQGKVMKGPNYKAPNLADMAKELG